jgi:hypothetical protein
MVAEPVFSVIHHTSPNWATALPTQESVCPVQMVKNRGAHFSVFQAIVLFGIVYLIAGILGKTDSLITFNGTIVGGFLLRLMPVK